MSHFSIAALIVEAALLLLTLVGMNWPNRPGGPRRTITGKPRPPKVPR